MSNIIQQLDAEQMKKDLPTFRAGDTVTVKVKVKEGTRERLQAFKGVVISKRNRGINSNFIVRKTTGGEGIERTFQTHSPMVDSISVERLGDVNQSKLYYLRERSGRSARIKERIIRKDKKADKPAAKKAATKEVKADKPAVKVSKKVEAKTDAPAAKTSKKVEAKEAKTDDK